MKLTLLLKSDVSLQKEADEILAKVVRLPLPAILVERLDDGLGKPIPGAGVIDEVVDDLVERLPAGLLHPLLEPRSCLKRKPGTDAGELDRPWGARHGGSLTDVDPNMKRQWSRKIEIL